MQQATAERCPSFEKESAAEGRLGKHTHPVNTQRKRFSAKQSGAPEPTKL